MPPRSTGKKSDEWRQKAECRNADLTLFFPVDEEGEWIDNLVLLDEPGNPGSFCFKCKVQEECLEYAIDAEIVHGIFGGTNEIQRKKLINNAKKLRRIQNKQNKTAKH